MHCEAHHVAKLLKELIFQEQFSVPNIWQWKQLKQIIIHVTYKRLKFKFIQHKLEIKIIFLVLQNFLIVKA